MHKNMYHKSVSVAITRRRMVSLNCQSFFNRTTRRGMKTSTRTCMIKLSVYLHQDYVARDCMATYIVKLPMFNRTTWRGMKTCTRTYIILLPMPVQQDRVARDEDLHQNVYNYIAHVSLAGRRGKRRKLAPECV